MNLRLHLFDDTIRERIEDHDVDDPDGFCYGRPVTHVLVEVGPYDDVHLIEFRDDGWTIQHSLTERVNGTLFDCPMTWTGGDPGVRGRFVLDGPNMIGRAVT